jgi:hypothetical protein
MADLRGKDREFGPRSTVKSEVETALVLPKTLQAQTELMPFSGTTVPMFAVYGTDDSERRVWCATFLDDEEAMAWVQASKVFGRAVKGAVIAKQLEVTDGTRTDDRAQAKEAH